MEESTTVEGLKRQLMASWSAGVAPTTNESTLVDSPLPMSPYNPTISKQLSLTQRTDMTSYHRAPDMLIDREKEHISSLAVNLSHQMEYNNSLLFQVEALEIKNASGGEKIQYLETEVAQLRGTLRMSTEQTLQLEKQINATVTQYEIVLDENKALREETKNVSAEAVRLNAQAEAQRRRASQLEETNQSQLQKITQLEATLLHDRDRYKADSEQLTRTVIDLEASLKRMEQLNNQSDTSQAVKDRELRDIREEGIAISLSFHMI